MEQIIIFIKEILLIMETFFINYGAAGVFWYSFFETLLLIPPTEVVLIPVILLDPENWFFYSNLAIIATVLGAIIGYYLAYIFGEKIIKKIIGSKYNDKAYNLFEKYGVLAVLVGAMTPIPFTVFVLLAGFSKMKIIPFILVTFLARGFRFWLVGYLTHEFQDVGVDVIKDNVDNFFLILFIFIMISFIIYKIIKRKNKKDIV